MSSELIDEIARLKKIAAALDAENQRRDDQWYSELTTKPPLPPPWSEAKEPSAGEREMADYLDKIKEGTSVLPAPRQEAREPSVVLFFACLFFACVVERAISAAFRILRIER